MNVDDALRTRISIRAFTQQAVAQEVIHDILDVARWSPSGGNLQPWRVIAVAGEARQAVIDAVRLALAANPRGEQGEHPMYPAELWEPYRTRRYEVGEDMYVKLGIPRSDRPARLARVAQNLEFFGAPVGLFFVIDRRMGHGQWAHLGMFMQSIALAAVERGLGTCMQEAWAQGRETLRVHFGLADTDLVYCGMAVGYADPDAPVNTLRSTREPVEGFTTFQGW